MFQNIPSKLERLLENIMDKFFTIGFPMLIIIFIGGAALLLSIMVIDLFAMKTEIQFDCERQEIVTITDSVFFKPDYKTEYVGKLECEIRKNDLSSND